MPNPNVHAGMWSLESYGIVNHGWIAAHLILLGIIILAASWSWQGFSALGIAVYLNYSIGTAISLLAIASTVSKFGAWAAINLTIVGLTLIAMGVCVYFTGEL